MVTVQLTQASKLRVKRINEKSTNNNFLKNKLNCWLPKQISMNSALASLTECYTDSENEDNNDEDSGKSDPEEKQTKAQIVINSKKNSKLPRRLVSYNENEVYEDDEPNQAEEVDEEKNADNAETTDKLAKYIQKYGFELPPEPKGKLDPKLQETVSNINQKVKNSAFDLNQYIQEKKEFRNPSIYDKLIQFCNINELDTNFPPEIYDISIYGPESFYEELAKAQKLEMDKLEKQKKENTKTEVMIIKTAESIKRKSKWDQQAPSSITGSSVTTSSSTSGKTTVISAFGTLKKPKV